MDAAGAFKFRREILKKNPLESVMMGKLRVLESLETAVLVFFAVCFLSYAKTASAGGAGCVTGKCHSAMSKGKFVHGPVATGDCIFCHQPAGQHKFKPVPGDISVLCYKCHGTVETAAKAHPPLNGAQCTKCHSPHQSDYEYQLRGPAGLSVKK